VIYFKDERVKENAGKSLLLDAFSIKSNEINRNEVERSQFVYCATAVAFAYKI
jgi:hypothetical protein